MATELTAMLRQTIIDLNRQLCAIRANAWAILGDGRVDREDEQSVGDIIKASELAIRETVTLRKACEEEERAAKYASTIEWKLRDPVKIK